MHEPLVEMCAITKRFARVTANDDVSFSADRGEIHALVGENGAGKSTLMRILYGSTRRDEGVVRLRGKEVRFRSPRDAIQHGIGMVHQHAELVGSLRVTENVVLGAEPTRRGIFDRERAREEVFALGLKHKLSANPDAEVSTLGVGERQRVEILRALHRGAEILILDEPTAVLTPLEVEALFDALRVLRAQGTLVILVTHRLGEVMAHADRVTVMRGGKTVAVRRTAETSIEELGCDIVGRLLPPAEATAVRSRGERVFELAEVSARRPDGNLALAGVSLELFAHEIVGIAGVEGNGQTELTEIAAGVRAPDTGHVRFCGKDVTRHGRRALLEAGVAFVPEDRLDRGLVATFSVEENLVLGRAHDPSWTRAGMLLRRGRLRDHARASIAEYDIRPPDPRTPVAELSGGNQQKVVLARELAGCPRVAIIAQPTRGVDVGASALLHARIRASAEAGCAILLVSAELTEILALAHRVLVIARGCIRGSFPVSEASAERLGPLMLGEPT